LKHFPQTSFVHQQQAELKRCRLVKLARYLRMKLAGDPLVELAHCPLVDWARYQSAKLARHL
jgi:hypothetical protein